MSDAYFQRGLGLRDNVKEDLRRDYHSTVVDRLRASGYVLTVGETTIRLAEEFGFCYGVDRAVDYAYQTRSRFPDKRLFLAGEIIHNPGVNARLREMGVLFTGPEAPPEIQPGEGDVVIIPAFGVPLGVMEGFRARGCLLVDTTCGSVLNVWKNVERYARDGFTSVIHGKYRHEETRATASRALRHPAGRYLVVRDLTEADFLSEWIRRGGERREFLARFAEAISPGFDPDRDLQRIGLANQTTMLSSESLEIAARLRRAMEDRWGAEGLDGRFRSFDTICSATQDRQDAVLKLVAGGIDLMIVIGGYNSSNTTHLAEIAAAVVPTYHVSDASCLLDPARIRHKSLGADAETESEGWLPSGPLVVGLTAGASTPNGEVGAAIERVLAFRGLRLP